MARRTPTVAEPAANRRGMTLMMAAMACYVLNDTLVKLTLQVFPPGQILTVRGLVASILVALAAGAGASGIRQDLRQPLLLLRCGLEISTALASVLALLHASLPVVSALMMTAPLLIAISSMALRWEPPNAQRLLAVAGGFGGTLLILQPDTQADADGLSWALLCALSLAARDMVTRQLPASISSTTVTLVATVAVCMAGPALGLAWHETWGTLARREALALVGAAACSAMGNYALVAACRGTDLSVVIPFRYSIIVWSCLLGYLVWGDIPDLSTLAGIAVIAVAGLANLRAMRAP